MEWAGRSYENGPFWPIPGRIDRGQIKTSRLKSSREGTNVASFGETSTLAASTDSREGQMLSGFWMLRARATARRVKWPSLCSLAPSMIFTETKLRRVSHRSERREDRGFFARAFCQNEFAAHGRSLSFTGQHRVQPEKARFAACTFSFLRRLKPSSFAPAAARCSTSSWTCGPSLHLSTAHQRGAQRRQSPRHLHSQRFAHGYQALEDDTETTYTSASSTRLAPRRSSVR